MTNFLTTNVASLASAPTDALVPDIRIARKMKASLQADYDADLGPLGDGWLFGAQLLYDKNIWGYQWVDLRSVPNGTLPDGRRRYGPFGGSATTNRDLLMTNSTKGRAYFATLRVAKEFGDLSIDGSYTRSDVKDVAALTSSTSSSNYGNNAFVDPNYAAYGRSIYEYRDQWKFGHHRSNRGLRWIAIASHHTENDVALRADADQIVVFDDENGGRVPLLHDDCGITNRGVVSGGRKGPLTYDFAN